MKIKTSPGCLQGESGAEKSFGKKIEYLVFVIPFYCVVS